VASPAPSAESGDHLSRSRNTDKPFSSSPVDSKRMSDSPLAMVRGWTEGVARQRSQNTGALTATRSSGPLKRTDDGDVDGCAPGRTGEGAPSAGRGSDLPSVYTVMVRSNWL
jgi:hypothetical protein